MKILKVLLCILLPLIIIVFFLYLNRIPYKVKAFTRDIFSASDPSERSSQISVKRMHSGDIKVPLSNPLNLKHPACSEIKDKEITVPVFAYLIHHEKYGYFLIDSGCDSSYVNDPHGPMNGLLINSFVPETTLRPEDSIEKQLGDIKKEIRGVFFTHLHPDHTSGLRVLSENITYVAGKGEESLQIKWIFEANHFRKTDTVYMLDFNSKESKNHSIGKAIDIFGDGSLLAISTPGHTKGHVSYLVNNKDHPVLVSGDAICVNMSMEVGVGPGTCCSDTEVAQKTFERIYRFAKDNPEVEIWAGHDY